MDLILWRHAEAEDGKPDAARALTPKGVKQAERMAHWLRRRLPRPVRVLASPARRTQQTAGAYCTTFESRPELAMGATAAQVLRAAGWPHGKDDVMIVGHQPSLGAAAALALTGKPLPWSIKKGAIWWLRSTSREPPFVVAVVTPRLVRGKRKG